jgi:uncharacterized protein (TIGR02444 family)
MLEPDGDEVWREMCALYGDPDLARMGLALQDGFGVDAPLLLFLALADKRGETCGEAALAAFIAAAAGWRQQVILPLRTARRAMKGQFLAPAEMALRDKVKQLELDAERLHVDRLAKAWQPIGGGVKPAASFYLERCRVPEPDIARFLRIAGASATRPFDAALT